MSVNPKRAGTSNIKLIPLTQGKFAIVDATDFNWLIANGDGTVMVRDMASRQQYLIGDKKDKQKGR